ncbi:hypothetical protein Taro_009487 [Colocasia esculenta]|uniref:Uncharacterized protein n=1 Tax=Colocasia esculenta TaxID=4460 RepID=A0A843U4X4_COLES|nr:hypothetical protein [Colocasia esculenta]
MGRSGFEDEELGKKLERSFLPIISPPLGLSSWSSNLLARARAGHVGFREVANTCPRPPNACLLSACTAAACRPRSAHTHKPPCSPAAKPPLLLPFHAACV